MGTFQVMLILEKNFYKIQRTEEEERLVSFDGDSKTYELVKFRKTKQGDKALTLKLS